MQDVKGRGSGSGSTRGKGKAMGAYLAVDFRFFSFFVFAVLGSESSTWSANIHQSSLPCGRHLRVYTCSQGVREYKNYKSKEEIAGPRSPAKSVKTMSSDNIFLPIVSAACFCDAMMVPTLYLVACFCLLLSSVGYHALSSLLSSFSYERASASTRLI